MTELAVGMSWDEIVTAKAEAVAESSRLRGGYHVALTCPHDGAPVEHVAASAATRWEMRALVACTECCAQFVIAVRLYADESEPRRKPIAHGTEAGYQQHRRRPDDPPCAACLDAHNEYNKPGLAARRSADQLELIR